MVKVLLDTNILISIFELNLDILGLINKEFGKEKYFTLDLIVNELKMINTKNAKMAIKLIDKMIPVEKFNLNGIKSNKIKKKSVDECLIDYSMENSCILATQDAELIKKAKSKHLKILQIRQNKYLEIR